jgi:hypothetical protein
LRDKITLIKAEIVSFSHLNQRFLTQSKVILTSTLRATAIFNAIGIRTYLFGTTKLRSFCLAIVKNSLL